MIVRVENGQRARLQVDEVDRVRRLAVGHFNAQKIPGYAVEQRRRAACLGRNDFNFSFEARIGREGRKGKRKRDEEFAKTPQARVTGKEESQLITAACCNG